MHHFHSRRVASSLLAAALAAAVAAPAAAEPGDDTLKQAAMRAVMFVEAKSLGDSYWEGLPELERACLAVLDARVAAGATEATEIATNWLRPMPLAEARMRVCGVVEAGARRRAADGAAAEAERQPLVDAGIAGDKLALVADAGFYFLGKGGIELRSPEALAKASLLFEVLVDDLGRHTVRRHQFKGNRRIKTSERTYREAPGSRAFR